MVRIFPEIRLAYEPRRLPNLTRSLTVGSLMVGWARGLLALRCVRQEPGDDISRIRQNTAWVRISP